VSARYVALNDGVVVLIEERVIVLGTGLRREKSQNQANHLRHCSMVAGQRLRAKPFDKRPLFGEARLLASLLDGDYLAKFLRKVSSKVV